MISDPNSTLKYYTHELTKERTMANGISPLLHFCQVVDRQGIEPWSAAKPVALRGVEPIRGPGGAGGT